MRRAGLYVIVVLALGVWVEPLITDAGDATLRGTDATLASTEPSTQPQAVVSSDTPEPSSYNHGVTPTQPTTQPSLKLVRGTDGFWKIVQTDTGIWWFQSPSGDLEFLNTVTTVQPFQLARDKEGPSFVSTDWDGGAAAEGNLEAWATKTIARATSTGFKGFGAWSHPIFHKYDVPITRDLNVWKWMKGDPRLYSPDWPAQAEHAVKVQCEPLRDNRNLVGYFIDNELDWGDGGIGPSLHFDNLPPDDPNRQQVMRVIQSVWTNLDNFNTDWQVRLSDWKEVEAWTTLPHPPTGAYGRLFSAWLSHLAADYFRITTQLIRKHDPNHLILGVRFKGYAPLEVVRASKGYTDAQSINYYVSDGRLDLELFRMMTEQSEQPVMIGEYSFHSLDGRSGNRNTVGFAAQVLDQQARADGYRLMTTRLARVPYVIGCDWFQWSDEPPSGRSHDGEDVNFGVVDVDDRPYELLVDAIRKTSPRLNPMHAVSVNDEQKDVWRESFAAKPVARVPFLDAPIRLNGELSDWPAATKVQGIRHSQTIGLERSPLPVPNVYLGWTKEGLYLGLEVFDNDIQGAPAKGWWWTRDNVEFWLSTRPVPSDQNAYDGFSHQFFFVPIDFPASDGIAGVVGQWHRPGDALKDSLIPHPDVKEAVRILPDRYVVEVFMPAASLNGYDPANHPALAFNIHLRNFQHAIDYFWSAPKEVMTQLRPNTWGSLYLESRATAEAQAMVDPR
ncbi:MAG: hypothetical protein ACREIT_02705 [Tepidisphaeraceae bacterium]